MKPPFPFKDIAKLAKLSTATADRAWHQRPGYTAKARTKVLRAIEELERQCGSGRESWGPTSIHVVAAFAPRFDLEFRELFESEMEQIKQHPMTFSYHIEHFGGDAEIELAINSALSEDPDYLFIFAPRFSIGPKTRRKINKSETTAICLTRDDPKLQNSLYCGFNDIVDAEKSAYVLANFARSRQDLVIVTEGCNDPYQDFIAAFAQKIRTYLPKVRVAYINCAENDIGYWSGISIENSFFLCIASPTRIPEILVKNRDLPICYLGLFGDEFASILTTTLSAFSLTVPISNAIPNVCRVINSDIGHRTHAAVQISRAFEFP